MQCRLRGQLSIREERRHHYRASYYNSLDSYIMSSSRVRGNPTSLRAAWSTCLAGGCLQSPFHFVQFLAIYLTFSRIPILLLVDADVYGLEIASVYTHGSIRMRHEADSLMTRRAIWLGLKHSDLRRFSLLSVSCIAWSII